MDSPLTQETLDYLISLLNKVVTVHNGAHVIRGVGTEYDEIIDTIVDSVCHNNRSFVELYSERKLSRKALRRDVEALLPDLLLHAGPGSMNRYLIQPLLGKVAQKRPHHTHYFLFPLNLDMGRVTNLQDDVEYKGTDVHIYTYRTLSSSKFFKPFQQADSLSELRNRSCSSDRPLDYTSYTYFLFKVKGPDIDFLIDFASKLYNELLALINLSLHMHRYHVRFANKLSARSPLKYSPIVLEYDSRKRYKRYYYADNLPFESRVNYDSSNYKTFLSLLKAIKKLPKHGPLNDLIFKNLRLYQDGISSIYVEFACLHFWNSIEGATKPNDSGHVPARVNSILKNASPHWQLKMERLREKRNHFAHNSISHFTNQDSQFLKRVSETLFLFLISHAAILKSVEDLEALYNIGEKKTPRLKSDLSRRRRELELARYVLKERSVRAPTWLYRAVK